MKSRVSDASRDRDSPQYLLDRLNGVRERGTGWRAHCPAHDDGRPSLDIDLGDDGRILLICRSAGCSAQAIVGAVGLTLRDLQPPSGPYPPHGGPRPKKKELTFATIDEAVQAACGSARHGGSWVYQDADGQDSMLVVRRDLRDGSKDFRQLHRAQGLWAFGSPTGPRHLLDLPRLLRREADHAFVVEGEKCVDALNEVGLLATTSSGGANSPQRSDWAALAPYAVTILIDNDDPGRTYGQRVSRILLAQNPGARVSILALADLPVHGDVVDWIAARRDEGLDNDAIAEQLSTLEGERIRASAESKDNREVEYDREPVLTRMADIESQEVEWLWKGRVPLGRLTLLVGAPGTGKSYVTTDIAARVSTGTAFPDGAPCVHGEAILISAEDDPADTIRPRLDALGADVTRVHLLVTVRCKSAGRTRETLFTLKDLDALDKALGSHPACRLVVVDPIGSFLGGDVDSYRDNEVRSVLAPLAALAQKHRVAIIVVMHRRKGTGGRADELALGSVAFTGIARAVWHVTKDAKDAARRLLLAGKQNLSPEGHGLAFRIEHEGPVGRLVWERAPVKMSADEALRDERAAEESKPGPIPRRRAEAEEWLKELLADGSLAAAHVEREAKAAGLAWRTVQRACRNLGIKPRRDRFDGGWTWDLPAEDANSPSS